MPALLAAHFPAEVQRQATHASEVHRDKALAAERVIRAAAEALKAPPLAARPMASHRPDPTVSSPPAEAVAPRPTKPLPPELQARLRAEALAKHGQVPLPPIIREPATEDAQ
jgi:hypothetical protein